MKPLWFPNPPLTDGVIRLRPWSEVDLGPALEATQDPLIPRYTHTPENNTMVDVRAHVAHQQQACTSGEALGFAVADAATDGFLGAISLLRFDWTQARGEVGYWLAPWARGRGVATSAVLLVSRFALCDLGVARLALHADTDNAASQRVAERCGFTREGVLRSFEERKGQRRDLVVYSLLATDLA